LRSFVSYCVDFAIRDESLSHALPRLHHRRRKRRIYGAVKEREVDFEGELQTFPTEAVSHSVSSVGQTCLHKAKYRHGQMYKQDEQTFGTRAGWQILAKERKRRPERKTPT